MTQMVRMSLAWLCLPALAWLGLQVYSLGMLPVQAWLNVQPIPLSAWLVALLVGLGHAALLAWPLVKIYGRAAGAVSFVMIWPVIWHYADLLFVGEAAAELRLFWMLALGFYVLALFVMVGVLLRVQPLQRLRRRASVETLMRRYTRRYTRVSLRRGLSS